MGVKKGKEKEFIDAWTEMAQLAIDKFDNGNGQLMQDAEHPSKFVSVGRWSNEKAIQNWRQSDEFKKIFSRIMPMLTEPGQPQLMKIVSKVGEHVMF